MQTPPDLFDRGLLSMRRVRAAGFGAEGEFLHVEIADQVSERLQEVNKSFQSAAIIGPKAELWVEALGNPAFRAYVDGEVLDLQESSLDLVVHGLALHWANDPVGQLVQMRRALKPDGLMIAAMFGGQTLNELRTALAEAETEFEGGLSPRIAPMGEIRDLGGLIQRAGLALPVADSVNLTVTYETPLHLMQDLRAMGETNVMHARRKTPMRRKTLMRAMDIYTEYFAEPDGRVPATFEIVFLTGWAPSETQQKSLRPGSAKARLADALQVPERSAGDKAKN
ncbi:MAG: methyltransferase domain-containing protein [Paracoccaceae bacterium]